MKGLFEISLLLDFYGQLLTRRQYEVLDMHYNNDYSLGEIGEILDISRQAVYDNIKRGKKTLYEIESKLGLVARFKKQKEKARLIQDLISGIDRSSLTIADIKKLELAQDAVTSIMED